MTAAWSLIEYARRVARWGQRAALRWTDPEPARALELTDEYSLMGQRRRIALYRVARRVIDLGIVGEFAEFGVNRGGGIGMVAADVASDGRRLHLFDRWGDYPEATAEDGTISHFTREGLPGFLAEIRAQGSRQATQTLLEGKLGLAPDQITYHEGWFEDTFPGYEGSKITFAHIDANLYEPTKLALEFLDQHLADEAVLVLDDWGFYPGVEQAFDAYRSRTKRRLQVLPRRGQALVLVGALRAARRPMSFWRFRRP